MQDPKIVSLSGLDFHLQSNSALIDAGSNLGNLAPNDFDGVTRHRAPDMISARMKCLRRALQLSLQMCHRPIGQAVTSNACSKLVLQAGVQPLQDYFTALIMLSHVPKWQFFCSKAFTVHRTLHRLWEAAPPFQMCPPIIQMPPGSSSWPPKASLAVVVAAISARPSRSRGRRWRSSC